MLFTEELEEYLTRHTTSPTEILSKLERETYLTVVHPRMLSGNQLGSFLTMISYMIRPGRILEIGTYTGYSAICLAAGLTRDGILHTIEINIELREIIEKYLEEAGVKDKVTLHFGDALEIIPELDEIFDLVFIDAAKEHYLDYYHAVFDKLKDGGYIIADNVLWDGKVLEKKSKMDRETCGIADFNEFIQKDERVENVMLPVRDGVMVVRKR